MLAELPLSNPRVHATAYPGADCHALGLSQWADGFDRVRREANRDMSRERLGTATARLSRGWLTVGRVVVVLEGVGVVARHAGTAYRACSSISSPRVSATSCNRCRLTPA